MTDNELIAEFMGFCPLEAMPISKQKIWKLMDSKGNPIHPYYGPFRSEQMQFENSWDWLMPVVQKIEGEQFAPTRVKIECNECTVIGKRRFKVHTMKKINSVYQCVVQFIKWHNSQSKVTYL